MAKILFKARDADPIPDSDPQKAQNDLGRFLAGHPVAHYEDDYNPGTEECLPSFFFVSVPGVPVARIEHLVAEYRNVITKQFLGIRHWRLDLSAVPTAIRRKVLENGELIVKAGTYAGTYDVTWPQVRDFIKDALGNPDTADL